MRHPPLSRRGATLVELVVVLAILALLAAAAAPAFGRAIAAQRARAALDLLVAEIYRARMLAVQHARPVRLTISGQADGCAQALRLTLPPSPDAAPPTSIIPLDLGRHCLTHTGDSTLVFDGRGMLRPPSRSFRVELEGRTDTVFVAVSGRVRRSY